MYVNLPSVAIVGVLVLVVGNNGSVGISFGEDDDSVVVGVVGDDGS